MKGKGIKRLNCHILTVACTSADSKWSYSGQTLKADPAELTDELDVGCEREESRILVNDTT